MTGGYYLHTNGSLIYKPRGLSSEDIADSDLVVKYWQDSAIGVSPATFVDFLHNARTLGATDEEIVRLAQHNQLDTYFPGWALHIFGEVL